VLEPLSLVVVTCWLLAGLIVQGRACTDQWQHLSAQCDEPAEARRARYGRRRAIFQWLSAFEQFVRFGVWIAAGLLVAIHAPLGVSPNTGAASAAAAVLVFVLVFAVLDAILCEVLIFARWRWVERACGVSTMTLRDLAGDALRRVATRALISVAAGSWILWPLLLGSTGVHWAMSGVLLLIGAGALYWARPQLIEPLFHHFAALPPGELRDRLEAMMRRCGGEIDNVLVMDSSRRSRLANAHFAGLGRRKRVVLSDTLIERLSPAELEAVMAHELGHFRCGHLRRYYGVQAALLFAGYVIFGLLQGAAAPTVAPVIWAVAAYVLLPALAWPLQPVFARMRRQFEYEADAFSAAHAERAALVSALENLLSNNLGNATMAPAYARRYATHPPSDARLARLQT